MRLLQDLSVAGQTMALKISALTIKRPIMTFSEIGLLTDNTYSSSKVVATTLGESRSHAV